MAHHKRCFVFVFPAGIGHLNPSLPLARRLVNLGNEVHYICHGHLQAKIEATGAAFHSAVSSEPELYEGRGLDYFSMITHLKEELGVGSENMAVVLLQLRNAMVEMQLPGLLRLLLQINPDVIVSCPVACSEAGVAAKILGVGSVALNTFAGPGAISTAIGSCLDAEKLTYEEADQLIRSLPANLEARHRMREKYGLIQEAGLPSVPGYLDSIASADLTLTTTSDDLQDPMSLDLDQAYREAGANLIAVGPLLDCPADWRPLGDSSSADIAKTGATDVIAQVQAANAIRRPVVLVSMGTVVTGDMPFCGWKGRPTGPDGRPRGLSGKELCQAAWSGAFDAFGSETAEQGVLLVVAVGTQPDALEGLAPPPNAVCLPFLPQVDLLRAGVDVFLTHGGQNSFTESMAHGRPVVVCPGFADQIINSQKAVRLGVGLKVDRPNPEAGELEVAAAVKQYRADVQEALSAVFSKPTFKAAALACAERLAGAGGVEGAVELMLKVAEAKQRVLQTESVGTHRDEAVAEC